MTVGHSSIEGIIPSMAKIKMIFITRTFCTLEIYALVIIFNAADQGPDFLALIIDRHTEFGDLCTVLELVPCTRSPLGSPYSRPYTG